MKTNDTGKQRRGITTMLETKQMSETTIFKTCFEVAVRAMSRLLSTIGFKQRWHISWTAKIPGKETSFGDGTYTFRPRLTAAMINDLRATLAKETGSAAGITVEPSQVNIISMARIGG